MQRQYPVARRTGLRDVLPRDRRAAGTTDFSVDGAVWDYQPTMPPRGSLHTVCDVTRDGETIIVRDDDTQTRVTRTFGRRLEPDVIEGIAGLR